MSDQNTPCAICGNSSTQTHMENPHGKPICDECAEKITAYEAKLQARVQRMRESADRIYADGKRQVDRAHQMAQSIPFGQPILVGHHSEKRDRRFRVRIHNTFGRGFAAMERAKTVHERADSAEKNRAISSDDPAAVIKLQEKIDAAEKRQEFMKRANACARKHMKRQYDNEEARHAAIAEELGIKPSSAATLLKPDFAGRIGFPAYELTNNNANIRRMKQRIEDLKKAEAARQNLGNDTIDEHSTGIDGLSVVYNRDENRVQLIFDEKPDAQKRSILKQFGFRWAPSNMAWQRHLNEAGKYAAHQVMDRLGGDIKVYEDENGHFFYRSHHTGRWSAPYTSYSQLEASLRVHFPCSKIVQTGRLDYPGINGPAPIDPPDLSKTGFAQFMKKVDES